MEPPLAGTEIEHLLGALDRLRATFRWKADGLDEDGLRTRLPSSALTLGGLLEGPLPSSRTTPTPCGCAASPSVPRGGGGLEGDPEWEFTSAAKDSAHTLYALYDGAVDRSRHRLRVALERGPT